MEVVSLVPESLFLGEASRVGVIHITSVHRVHIVVVGIAGFAILGPEAKLRHRQELELLVRKTSHQPVSVTMHGGLNADLMRQETQAAAFIRLKV